MINRNRFSLMFDKIQQFNHRQVNDLTAGAKDIYIVVKDAASTVSNALTIHIAAVAENFGVVKTDLAIIRIEVNIAILNESSI